ncbi:MAG TPA: VOC family protein [Gaiellaceae bacterium]|nr:VOC family protein [Gaiellaceae bacterium]
MRIERTDFVAVPVTEVGRSARFYGEVLGLDKNPNSLEDWIEFETGNLTLALVSAEGHGREFAPLPRGSVALRVADLAAAKAKLEAAGVECGDTWDSGVCNGFSFSDPDGNGLLLHHRYAPYPDGTKP